MLAQACKRRSMRPIRRCEPLPHWRMGKPDAIAQTCPNCAVRARPARPEPWGGTWVRMITATCDEGPQTRCAQCEARE